MISRNGHDEFLDFRVNKSSFPGDEIKLNNNGAVNIEVKWTAKKELTGKIELVCNGKVVDSKDASVKPGEAFIFRSNQSFTQSGWLCARRMDEKGHQSHTAPVYIILNNKPVRTSVIDAEYFVNWIDNILTNIAPGGIWSKYYTHDLEQVRNRYKKAKDIYSRIAEEAQNINK